MKIAMFTDTFLPQINGVASSIANTAKVLDEYGHEVIIFTPEVKSLKGERFITGRVKVVHLPTLPGEIYTEWKLSLFGYPKALRTLNKFDPDIIHFHTPVGVGFTSLLLAKTLKKPLVGTIHYFFANPNYLGWINNKIASRLIKRLNKLFYSYSCFFYSFCDLRLAPSKTLIEEIRKSGYKKSIQYLPNGIFLENLPKLSDKQKASLKKRFDLKEKVVLHFGRLSAEKKVEEVVKAFSQIVLKHKNVSLLVVGDGPTKQKLEKLAEKLRVRDRVIFTGFIAHSKLISSGILQIADVFVTASDMETQPMTSLEAMSFGLPIVGVKEAGQIELVKNNGFLVKPGDVDSLAKKTEEVLFDNTLRENMSKESLKLARSFSIRKTTQKLLEMYRDLTEKKDSLSSQKPLLKQSFAADLKSFRKSI